MGGAVRADFVKLVADPFVYQIFCIFLNVILNRFNKTVKKKTF